MIVNVKLFNKSELQQFEQLYTKYFRQVIHYRSDMSKEESLSLNKFFSKKYTKNMIKKIMSNQKISFALIDEGQVLGLITGHCDEDTKEAWLSHIFVDQENNLERRISTLQLYRTFSEAAKGLGMKTIATDVEKDDLELLDTLEELAFEQIKVENEVMEYGRAI